MNSHKFLRFVKNKSMLVQLLGMVPHSELPKILSTCHIFLNTALTEAFCIAICEAARMGLSVVSSNVGGIPEVLPSELAALSPPTVSDLLENLKVTIENIISRKDSNRREISKLAHSRYNWDQICEKTDFIYL